MKRSDRRMTKRLTISRETVRALTRLELVGAVGGLDTTDPCVVKPFGAPSKDAPCG
jgi:hypothetical protein